MKALSANVRFVEVVQGHGQPYGAQHEQQEKQARVPAAFGDDLRAVWRQKRRRRVDRVNREVVRGVGQHAERIRWQRQTLIHIRIHTRRCVVVVLKICRNTNRLD